MISKKTLTTDCFVNEVVPKEVKERYEFSNYLIDPNRFRFRKVVRILGLVFRFVKIFCDKYGKGRNLVGHSKVNLDPIPQQFSCVGEQFLVTSGVHSINRLECQGGKLYVYLTRILNLQFL